MQITTIGLDIAKHVFQLIACDVRGKVVKKKRLRRGQVLRYFAQLPRVLIGIEGCASAHYWGRELSAQGHEVALLPARYVKGYVRGNKNDYNDALAIAEAVRCSEMRRIPIKTAAQQDVQALHRLREGQIKGRTAHANRVRGLLAEYGIIVPQGLASLRRRIPEILEDGDNGLSPMFRELLAQSWDQLHALDEQIVEYDRRVRAHSRADEHCRRLQTVPGYGPIVASVFAAYVGDGRGYRRGRDVSASVGLVPGQYGTGGKTVLLSISKRGDRYVRCLLVHGARSVVRAAVHKDDPLSRWINQLRERRGVNKATVALANKMARIGWAVIRTQRDYQPV